MQTKTHLNLQLKAQFRQLGISVPVFTVGVKFRELAI